jgi:hypothetical protein
MRIKTGKLAQSKKKIVMNKYPNPFPLTNRKMPPPPMNMDQYVKKGIESLKNQ